MEMRRSVAKRACVVVTGNGNGRTGNIRQPETETPTNAYLSQTRIGRHGGVTLHGRRRRQTQRTRDGGGGGRTHTRR